MLLFFQLAPAKDMRSGNSIHYDYYYAKKKSQCMCGNKSNECRVFRVGRTKKKPSRKINTQKRKLKFNGFRKDLFSSGKVMGQARLSICPTNKWTCNVCQIQLTCWQPCSMQLPQFLFLSAVVVSAFSSCNFISHFPLA